MLACMQVLIIVFEHRSSSSIVLDKPSPPLPPPPLLLLLQSLMQHFGLRESANASPQTYALGLKEVWEVPEEVRTIQEC